MDIVSFFALQASRAVCTVDAILHADMTDLILFVETSLAFIAGAVITASTAMRRAIQANLAHLIEKIFIHADCACCSIVTTVASCQSSIAGRAGGVALVICVGLALTAYNIVIILQAFRAILDGYFTFHTHIMRPPVVLLTETGVINWFCLEIAINIAEQTHIWVEANLASDGLTGQHRWRFLIM